MKIKMYAVRFLIVAIAVIGVIYFPSSTSATHSWGGYHWARTANPFTLKVVDSNTPDWDDNKARAITDWSSSSVLDLVNEAGDSSSTARRRCVTISGKIHSCNYAYGQNGWLGLASINLTGGNHITQGTSKMNDSYFNSTSYTETNRQQVMCQEIGHTFGLDHQSTSGADLNTCMDYSNALDNPSPNAHDYAQLVTIYTHLDSSTTVGLASFISNPYEDKTAPENWGRLVRQSKSGRSSDYERQNMDGTKDVTHVFWTVEAAETCRSCDHRYDH